ncbi:hypothetical protein BU17DRAFT_85599 [Hysterangium stoloniferum]|nr:hypothetical protein BU17DRAFT_85599 [Hysterangium stoloniferum]
MFDLLSVISRAHQHRLATLDAFLESQRDLLARTQADLYKLAELRERALDDPEEFVENVEDDLSDPSFKMSEYFPPRVPEDIDWDLFSSIDPTAFSQIPIPGAQSPPKAQQSSPSELQLIVRQAAKDVLGNFHPFEEPEEEEDKGVAEAEAANEQRLAELVNLGRGDLPVTNMSMPLQRGNACSKIRLKHENELSGTNAKSKGKVDKGGARLNKKRTENSEPVVRLRSQRLRRPTTRADQIYTPLSPAIPSPQPPLTPKLPSPESLPLPDPDVTMADELQSEATSPDSSVPGTVSRRPKQKAKDSVKSGRRALPSETFNVPWSIAEQHLLEKLLEEIPSGEKNRWAKISKAMSGKRTPRQVASRVQKYFEKLKKFGVEPGT